MVAAKLAPCPETPPAVLEALALARRRRPRHGGGTGARPEPPPDRGGAGGRIGHRRPHRRPRRARAARRWTNCPARAAPRSTARWPPISAITLRGAALARLVDRGRGAADLARLLLVRPDVSAADLVPLYLHADPMRRAVIGRTVEATAALRPCPPAPRGLGETLTGLSAAHDVAAFVAALADGLGLPARFPDRRRRSGRPLRSPDPRPARRRPARGGGGLHLPHPQPGRGALGRAGGRPRAPVPHREPPGLPRPDRGDPGPAARRARAQRTAHQPLHGPEAKLRQGAERVAGQRVPQPVRARAAGGGEPG